MSVQGLSTLEQAIGRVLRVGVALSAGTLAVGLAWFFVAAGAGATRVLTAGLLLLMAIPAARIALSFADALRRHDRLLAWATALVLLVMALTIVYSLR